MRDFVRISAAVLLGLLAMPALAGARGERASSGPGKGDRGVAVADPRVPRPAAQACVVTLFAHTVFDAHGDPTAMTAQPHRWSYTPHCPGPWSKVVLESDFSVSAGRQYDRTASLWLDGVNLYFGTTQEPDAKVSPHWHVERDVSDYAYLFRHPGRGQIILNNWVSPKYTGIIRGRARLLFYPAVKSPVGQGPADRVYGLVGPADGRPFAVEDAKAALKRTLTLPRNVERAYLDVIAQSQATDEQWYMCTDDADVARTRDFSLGPPASGDPLEQCGHGNFREVEVRIDGQPAGRAPVYPWTYTGGVDPHLWRPTPDIQTLDFKPYRVDLTPFAAVLDDGRPHTFAVRVLGAHHFFNLAANLLLYLDHGRTRLAGGLMRNTLADNRQRLAPQVRRHWVGTAVSGGSNGEVDTVQQGDYEIAGQVQTSHGRVLTRVRQHSHFADTQQFLHPHADTYHQIITLDTRVTDTVSTSTAGHTDTRVQHLRYPQRVDIVKRLRPDGRFSADIDMQQGYVKQVERTHDGQARFWSTLDNALVSHNTADFNASGTAITGARDQHGRQVYRFSDALGSCYARTLETRNEAVSAVRSGQGCPQGVNHLDGRSHL